jgi:hypothetical protein
MKPVQQTDLTHGSGDALRACVASILELPSSKVPNLITDPRGYLPPLQEFLLPLGKAFVKVPLIDGRLPFPLTLPEGAYCYCIVAGPSPRCVLNARDPTFKQLIYACASYAALSQPVPNVFIYLMVLRPGE